MSQPKKLYFAYGSNMDPWQMYARCPEAEIVKTVRLEDYRLAYRGAGYATILPEQGSHVDGVLWRITARDEQALDYYEGFPRHYGKETVTVTAADGTSVEAMVYVMQPPMRDQPAMPSRYYLDTVLYGKRRFGLSEQDAKAEIDRMRQEVRAFARQQAKKYGPQSHEPSR